MKNKFFSLGSILSLTLSFHLMAQTQEESRSLGVFNEIKISNSIEAELVKGDSHSIEISASGLDLDRVETDISNRSLEVSVSGTNFGGSSVKVKITYVEIDELTANTSSKIYVKDILDAKMVKINASTASYVEAEVNCQSLELSAATNSKIFIDGTARNLDLKAFTNSEINGENLQTEVAQVRVNTAAQARFGVSESIKGSAATAGKVYYEGDPNIVDVRTNTGGEIERDL